MSPREGARGLAIGRAAFGAALLIVPGKVAKGWLGEYAERPAVHALVRSIGVRDLVLGMIALHTLEHPEVGPRWQATCAVWTRSTCWQPAPPARIYQRQALPEPRWWQGAPRPRAFTSRVR